LTKFTGRNQVSEERTNSVRSSTRRERKVTPSGVRARWWTRLFWASPTTTVP
jgi:hypothetical protein